MKAPAGPLAVFAMLVLGGAQAAAICRWVDEAKRPAKRVTDATPCLAWWRLYDESLACFAPHRTIWGAVKAEAFEHCQVVPSPVPKCGLRVQ